MAKINPAQGMINYINNLLISTKVTTREQSGLKLSKMGEQSVTERWNKSEKNGGYNSTERKMIL